MKKLTIDAADFIKSFQGAAVNLEIHKEEVNRLNVFPVPDGDTGTNMALTMSAASKAATNTANTRIKEIATAAAKGALMGARGNSGVILSQLFRGYAMGLEDKDVIGPKDIAKAMEKAVEVAYKGVMKPVEGTILTVARKISESALVHSKKKIDIITFMELVLQDGEKALNETPNQLPILRQAGVVDAGGKGLLVILQGSLEGLKGNDIAQSLPERVLPELNETTKAVFEAVNLEFPYCTEFIIQGDGIPEEELRQELLELGDSIVVVGDMGVVKVHIHTNRPGIVLEKGLARGTLHNIKIDNMVEQAHNEAQSSEENLAEVGFVAVASGAGLGKILKSMGVSELVEGGQTNNPSTEDLLKAVKKVRAKKVIILPNNKNIILAAKQLPELVEDQEVFVIPSRSVPQGISALLAYNAVGEFDSNLAAMEDALSNVITGEITFAVRTTQVDGLDINEGDIIGILDGKLRFTASSPEEGLLKLLELQGDSVELVTIYTGEPATVDQEEILDKLEEAFPDVELELHEGGQPLYYYLVSME